MTVGVFHFLFSPNISIDEAEMTLHLATFAAEGVHGKARIRIDFSYHIDPVRRLFFLDGSNEVGVTVVQIFTGLLLREFGEDAFQVERASSNQQLPQEIAA